VFPPPGEYGQTPAQVNEPIGFMMTFLDQFEQSIGGQVLAVDDFLMRRNADRNSIVVEGLTCSR